MKTSELRDKTDDELRELAGSTCATAQSKLQIARATRGVTNTSEFPRVRRDIARIKPSCTSARPACARKLSEG